MRHRAQARRRAGTVPGVQTPPATPATTSRRVRSLLQLALGLAILALVARSVDLGRCLSLATDADRYYLLLAVLMLFVDRLAMACKWRYLLAARGLHLGMTRAFALYLAGNLTSTVLPTSVAGDVLRGLKAAPTPGDRPLALASVLVERGLGLFASLLVALVASAIVAPPVLGRSAFWLAAAGVATLASGLALFLHPQVAASVARWPRPRLAEPVWQLGAAVGSYRREPASLLFFLALSVAEQCLSIAVPLVIARSLGAPTAVLTFFAVVPLVAIAETLPVSLGGLGIREGAYVALLGPTGMGADAAFAVSLLTRLAAVLVTAPGALVLLEGKRPEGPDEPLSAQP